MRLMTYMEVCDVTQIYNEYKTLCEYITIFVHKAQKVTNLEMDFDEIFWRDRSWPKDQVIRFRWRSQIMIRSNPDHDPDPEIKHPF